MRRNYYYLTIILFLISCSTSSSIYLEDGISKNSINDPFYVIPIDNRWVAEELGPNLPSSLDRVFYENLDYAISSATPVPFERISHEELSAEGNFKLSKLPVSSGSLEVYMASEELLNKLTNRYVIFLENYSFQSRINSNSGGSYAGHETENTRNLKFISEFYIWDNKSKKAISWGKVEESSTLREIPNENDYSDLMKKAAMKLLKESPIVSY